MWWSELGQHFGIGSARASAKFPRVRRANDAGIANRRGTGQTRLLQIVALLLLAGGLTNCGFHIRGDTQLPFRTLAIVGGENSSLVIDLKRTLRGNARVGIVDQPEQAEAVLYIIINQNDKSILTLSGGGRVREFQLTQKVMFRVADANGNEWMPTSEISVRRDFSFNDSQALAKEGEERLLLADMQADAVQQLLRRLSAVKRPG